MICHPLLFGHSRSRPAWTGPTPLGPAAGVLYKPPAPGPSRPSETGTGRCLCHACRACRAAVFRACRTVRWRGRRYARRPRRPLLLSGGPLWGKSPRRCRGYVPRGTMLWGNSPRRGTTVGQFAPPLPRDYTELWGNSPGPRRTILCGVMRLAAWSTPVERICYGGSRRRLLLSLSWLSVCACRVACVILKCMEASRI